ncbi:MAG: hypothetical protein K2P53_03655, partial [Rickettsiales bacterium]|nr:hypothetical protein [Rickettsiales bacterium]
MFEDASVRTKDRIVKELVSKYNVNELLYAASKSLKRDKRFIEAKVVKKIYNKKLSTESLTSEQSLALVLDANLSKETYQHLRNNALPFSSLYPSYHLVKEAKNKCYPENIQVSDYSAEVPLQALLFHTASRICSAYSVVLNSPVLKDCTKLFIIYKAGFDGATGQSVYKQLSDVSSELHTDESLFITCLVPLELYCFKDDKKQVVWRNPKPSSTNYCRPLRFKYRKESNEVILAEYESIMASIKEITLSVVPVLLEDGTTKEVEIQHIVNLTMIDGKIQTIISTATNSYQCCSVCGASPIEMNNLSLVVQKKTLEGNIKHGVSTLHAWIRFLECMLHISYKMPIMKWQARNQDDKNIVKLRKLEVCAEFRTRIGLVIDQPRIGGAGTSNDGNTARRFFQQYEVSASIMNIDVDLMKRLHIILATISSGYEINSSKFKTFCLETASLYVFLYPWYPMTQTLHKILIHGYEVIELFTLPLGMFSEEAQEATNKVFKIFRENFTRK